MLLYFYLAYGWSEDEIRNNFNNKNAFQYDAYRPLIDRIPWFSAFLGVGWWPRLGWVVTYVGGEWWPR